MSKNNINYCHTVQFKPKIYTKNPFDAKTSDARIEWGGGQNGTIWDDTRRFLHDKVPRV